MAGVVERVGVGIPVGARVSVQRAVDLDRVEGEVIGRDGRAGETGRDQQIVPGQHRLDLAEQRRAPEQGLLQIGRAQLPAPLDPHAQRPVDAVAEFGQLVGIGGAGQRADDGEQDVDRLRKIDFDRLDLGAESAEGIDRLFADLPRFVLQRGVADHRRPRDPHAPHIAPRAGFRQVVPRHGTVRPGIARVGPAADRHQGGDILD